MLQITDGHVTLTVTKGAFKGYYEKNGFRVLSPKIAPQNDVTPEGINISPSPENERSDEISQPKSAESDAPDESSKKAPMNPDEGDPMNPDEGEPIDLSEIPLGEMSLSQLNAYADQLGLSHEDDLTKKELRALIRRSQSK